MCKSVTDDHKMDQGLKDTSSMSDFQQGRIADVWDQTSMENAAASHNTERSLAWLRKMAYQLAAMSGCMLG